MQHQALEEQPASRKGATRDCWIVNASDGNRPPTKLFLASARRLQSPVKLNTVFSQQCLGLSDQGRVPCRILAKVPSEAQPLAALGEQIGRLAANDLLQESFQAGNVGALELPNIGIPVVPAAASAGFLVTVANLGDCSLYQSNSKKWEWLVSTSKKERTSGGLAHLNGWRLVTLEAIKEQVSYLNVMYPV